MELLYLHHDSARPCSRVSLIGLSLHGGLHHLNSEQGNLTFKSETQDEEEKNLKKQTMNISSLFLEAKNASILSRIHLSCS